MEDQFKLNKNLIQLLCSYLDFPSIISLSTINKYWNQKISQNNMVTLCFACKNTSFFEETDHQRQIWTRWIKNKELYDKCKDIYTNTKEYIKAGILKKFKRNFVKKILIEKKKSISMKYLLKWVTKMLKRT